MMLSKCSTLLCSGLKGRLSSKWHRKGGLSLPSPSTISFLYFLARYYVVVSNIDSDGIENLSGI